MSKTFFVLRSSFFVLMVACSTSFDSKGIYHRVRAGENLIWVAKSYGVDLQDLAELNNMPDPNQKIEPGQKLYIPPRRVYRHKKLPFEGELAKHIEKGPRWRKENQGPGRRDKIYTDHNRFIWPIRGTVLSPFGIRNGRRHDGVDIRARQGTPIVAADTGRVVYAGSMRGYGNLILLRHPGNFFTAYAHNSVNLVREKQKVKRGDPVGKVGRTGRATGPHLHFEVREGDKARNPLFFLPVIR